MKRGLRILAVVVAALMVCIPASEAQHKKSRRKKQPQVETVDKLRKERQTATRKINEATRKLKTNTTETRRQLNRLDKLRGDIAHQNEVMSRARCSVDSVSEAIMRLNDTIAQLDSSLVTLKRNYAATLRRMQSLSEPSSTLSYLISAESFTQAWQRVRYLRQFGKWRKRKAAEVSEARELLKLRQARLAELSRDRRNALERIDLASRKLSQQHRETEQIVSSLKKEESGLRRVLSENEQKRKKLDTQIDRMIREEQERQERERREAEERSRREAAERERREAAAKGIKGTTGEKASGTTPAKADNKAKAEVASKRTEAAAKVKDEDVKLTGSFESNKGRLLFPVTGKYTIVRGFGRQPHPELKHVETDNSGIDIETQRGAKVRSVFGGTVSAIFRQPGFNTIVMVRHGEYITIYAGLSDIYVKNGQKLMAGQEIGIVAADPDADNRTILHFELRRERQKLDPRQWVR